MSTFPEQQSSDLTANHFFGNSYRRWTTLLPVSWIPYLQLTRLNIAAPLALVYFPHLIGVLHGVATTHCNHSPVDILYLATLLFVGSILASNAAHAWDDLVDAPLDAKIERTKKRPIPRGAISRRGAFIFTLASAAAAASVLLFLPTVTAFVTIPTIVATTYYPFAKRHMAAPQLILGFSLAWGIMVGRASVKNSWPWEDLSAFCLVVAYIFIVIIYDTIYAQQDLQDDLKLGVGSTAVLFRNHMKLALSVLMACMAMSLYMCGKIADMGILYTVSAVGGSLGSVGLMLWQVKLKDKASCWFWFSTGFWSTMLSITAGSVSECVFR